MKTGAVFLLLVFLLAAGALMVQSQAAPDPLAPFRTPDGRLNIPGSALTPELQRLLFRGNELQPSFEFTFLFASRSPYPTAQLVRISFEGPNFNVLVHQEQKPETWGSAVGRLVGSWLPPVDWHAVGTGILASVRAGIGSLFDLFTVNARADTVTPTRR